jgi:hypothetical protein
MTCANCQAEMTTEVLEGHLGTSVSVDLCHACQMFWFDRRESLQLSPAAVLSLFRLIGDAQARPRPPLAAKPQCPRCGARLALTHDRQRNTPFQYMRCPAGHGRLVTFLNFLREKDFVRPLSAEQLAELRQSIKTVNCDNCGAPIDLAKASVCGHCGSPLSMIDMKQAGALVGALRAASVPREIDPAVLLRMERARRDIEASFDYRTAWMDEFPQNGLFGASLRALARLLKD